MNKLLLLLCCTISVPSRALGNVETQLDQLSEQLTWAGTGGAWRAHASGTIELEGYVFDGAPHGLFHTRQSFLFNPRLTLFLDAQAGARSYFFAQARGDRGFDAGDRAAEIRLDEYAWRYAFRSDGRLNVQVGKFAAVVGNWIPRHLGWENPFIAAPLPYESLTGIFDDAPATTTTALLNWADIGPTAGLSNQDPYRLPILWGPSYATGAAVSGTIAKFNYAVEIKNASLSSRPESWSASAQQWQHPTTSARLGFRPNAAWHLGTSLSAGSYLIRDARAKLPPSTTLGSYRQILLGQDLSYAWHHLQFWAEAYAVRFEIPRIGPADVFSYSLEAKYRFTPGFSAAVRWGQQLYGKVRDATGREVAWGRDVWRWEFAPCFRFDAHTELKLQYSLERGGTVRRSPTSLGAAQFVLRF